MSVNRLHRIPSSGIRNYCCIMALLFNVVTRLKIPMLCCLRHTWQVKSKTNKTKIRVVSPIHRVSATFLHQNEKIHRSHYWMLRMLEESLYLPVVIMLMLSIKHHNHHIHPTKIEYIASLQENPKNDQEVGHGKENDVVVPSPCPKWSSAEQEDDTQLTFGSLTSKWSSKILDRLNGANNTLPQQNAEIAKVIVEDQT